MILIFILILIMIYLPNCNCVNTRWQWYSTHLHTNNSQNNINNNRTTQITTVQHNNNKTTQITTEQHNNNKFGRVRTVPYLCEFNPGICLTTEEKARKNLSKGSRRVLIESKSVSIHITYYQNTHTYTHPHVTKQYKTTTVQIKTNTI